MRDSLTNPPTTLPHRGQNQTPHPCNVVSRAAPAVTSHSLAPSKRDGLLITCHCTFDRYTCRTKIAVSPSPSSKLPNLIDTESDMRRASSLPQNSPCNIRYIAHRPPESLDTLPSRAMEISRHPCREIFAVTPASSTKLPKSLGTFSNIRRGCSPRTQQREARGLRSSPNPPNANGVTNIACTPWRVSRRISADMPDSRASEGPALQNGGAID